MSLSQRAKSGGRSPAADVKVHEWFAASTAAPLALLIPVVATAVCGAPAWSGALGVKVAVLLEYVIVDGTRPPGPARYKVDVLTDDGSSGAEAVTTTLALSGTPIAFVCGL
ncbi:MAG: hypothetical protein A2150_07770 [Candidatus Muproteobacteria bacterium RBG_16_64_11]|uniref:Uncharacterized protein n=1 Tax=Candidatus Muproteobacteria bacterium RBG_16_64_11 TaxID=1817758 RepID=A0A1F6TFB7_9PROT|nr:MAG: hypothetical protein A2150_07770 [Candidatus Muproteobacteria bacterium RBG_16_64_11]